MTRGSWLLGAFLAVGALVGCDYDDPVPASDWDPLVVNAIACDTDEGVAAIFARECTNGTCHAGDRPKAQLDLFEPGFTSRLKGGESVHAPCRDTPLLVPGAPDQGLLMGKLLGDPRVCGDPMPPAGPLPPEDLQCIARWIAKMPAEPGPPTPTGP